jgi:general secretion pathway protein L
MADTLFCLDIHKESLAAVVVDKTTKIGQVTGCGTAEMLEQSFEAAIDQLKEQTGFVAGSSIVTLGAELFSFRNIRLPFTDRKKIEQVLPFELDDRLPAGTKNLLVDFAIAASGPQGADIVAAMINREYLADILTVLHGKGIDPDTISISGLATAYKIVDDGGSDTCVLIDAGHRWVTVFIIVNGLVALIRSFAIPASNEPGKSDVFVASVRQTLLASRLLDMSNPDYGVYLTGMVTELGDVSSLSQSLGGVEVRRYRLNTLPVVKIAADIQNDYQPESMDRALATALKGGTKSGRFNFRKDELKKRKSSQEYRHLLLKFAIPMALVCMAVAGYWAYEYRNLLARQETLRNQIVGVFKETLPGVEKIVNPVQQLQVINKQIRATYKPGGDKGAGYTIIDLLAELSSRIPATYKVKVVRLVADVDTLRIKAVTGDFNTVDNTQKELEKSHFFKNVVITSANQSAQGDEVSFELKLDLARE